MNVKHIFMQLRKTAIKVLKLTKYIEENVALFFTNLRNFDIRFAHWVLWGELAGRLKLTKLKIGMARKKRQYILHYLEETAKKQYHYDLSKKQLKNNPIIWMFWWTGISNAPDIVKISISSVRENAHGYDVCVLDQSNYLDYVTLPKHIVEKHNKGIISHAMFSDILRMTLLSLYGGTWIDATIICLRALPGFLKTVEYYSCKAYDPNSMQTSKSRWTSYFMAGNVKFKMFREAKELLYAYWYFNDTQIDYLLIDYVLEYIRIKDSYVRKTMESLPDNNLMRNELFNRLNEPYSEELLNTFKNVETFLYKCSWRYGKLIEKDRKGRLTMYGFLKEKYLG